MIQQSKEYFRKYRKSIKRMYFYSKPGKNTILSEEIVYNKETDSISYYSRFIGTNGHTLPIIDIEE